MTHTARSFGIHMLMALGLVAGGIFPAAAQGGLDALDPLVRAAAKNPRATKAVLVGVAHAGDRLVAVGESGIILLSDDQGASWSQASVPVSVTITSVTFPSPDKGWAVGHSGVILASKDAGTTWVRQLDGPKLVALTQAHQAQLASTGSSEEAKKAPASSASDPFLDVYFADDTHGLAVGAFGLVLQTRDGGSSWQQWRGHLPNAQGNHLYAVRAVGGVLYIVGERGAIFASDDAGETFRAVKSPYEGSFFGLIGTPSGGLVLYGLRGNVFLSQDKAQSWTAIKAGSGSAWLGATTLPDQGLVLVSQAGEIAQSQDGGASFALAPQRLAPLSGVAGTAKNGIVAIGVRGISRIETLPSKNK